MTLPAIPQESKPAEAAFVEEMINCSALYGIIAAIMRADSDPYDAAMREEAVYVYGTAASAALDLANKYGIVLGRTPEDVAASTNARVESIKNFLGNDNNKITEYSPEVKGCNEAISDPDGRLEFWNQP